MNVDDPKLTAYALGELAEAERAEMDELVAESPEAQHFVRETQDMARMLKAEYAADSVVESPQPANLIDIRDDPWFWSRARPLAIAALIAAAALVAAIILVPHNRNTSSAKLKEPGFIQLENVDPEAEASDSIANPIPAETIARTERVVIGQFSPDGVDSRNEVQVIEVVSDLNRLAALKHRLATNRLSKSLTPQSQSISHAYELIFLDDVGSVVAAARFYNAPGAGFLLQLSKNAYAADGRYFVGKETPIVPADWKAGIDYSSYVIPFPDWPTCIGYSPGA